MAHFQFGKKSLHYEMTAGLLPEDSLFIHGNLASLRWWTPTIDELKTKYLGQNLSGSAVTVDWLGCGSSSGPERSEDLDLRSLGKDMVSLARGLGLSEVNLVGHSTGCLIALCAALEAPELFRRIVLLDTVSAAGLSFDQSMYDAFTKMSQDREFCASILSSTIHQVDVTDSYIQSLFDDAFKVHPKIWHGIPDSLKSFNITRELKKIGHPTLVLHGEFDQLLPKKDAEALAKGLPNAKFAEIPGQGHCCNVENPRLFAELMTNFLFTVAR